MTHASDDAEHDEIVTALADGFALGLRSVLPEIEQVLARAGEKLVADLVKAQAKAVRTAASTARVNVR